MRIEELLSRLPDAGWLTPEVRARLGLDALLLAAWADGEASGARAVGVRASTAEEAEAPGAGLAAGLGDPRTPSGVVNRCAASGLVRLAPATMRRLGIPAGGAVICWPPDEPRPADGTAWMWIESLEEHLRRSLAGSRPRA